MLLLFYGGRFRIHYRLLSAFVRYILDAEIDKTAFEQKLEEVFDRKTRTTAMTLAQQYHKEGREEGKFLALQHAVLEALTVRFDSVPEGLS